MGQAGLALRGALHMMSREGCQVLRVYREEVLEDSCLSAPNRVPLPESRR